MNVRALAACAAATATLAAAATPAQAADAPYPIKPVTIVMPYSAGGSSDLMTRALAKGLTDAWGRNVLVENRPGASGMIGADLVAKAPPDGYTLLSTTSSYAGTVAIRRKLPFDPEKAFVPVAMIARALAGVVNTNNASVNKVLVSAEMKQLFDREGAAGAPMTRAQLKDLLPTEIARYRKASQEAGLKAE